MIVTASVYILLTSVWVGVCQPSPSCRENISGCVVKPLKKVQKCDASRSYNAGYNPCHETVSMANSKLTCTLNMYKLGDHSSELGFQYDDMEEVGGFSSNLLAIQHRTECSGVPYLALNLSWSIERASLKNVKGFLLNISFIKYGKQQTELRTFWIENIGQQNDTSTNEITFVYGCFLMNYGHTYNIEVRTLPPPRRPSSNNPISTSYNASCEPRKTHNKPTVRENDSKWNFCLKVDRSVANPSELSIYFMPVPSATSVRYKINLIKTNGIRTDMVFERKNHTVNGTQCLISTPIVFKDILPGQYNVTLEAPGYSLHGAGVFNIAERLVTIATTETEISTTAKTSALASTNSHDGAAVKYVYIFIRCFLGVASLILFLVCFYRKFTKRIRSTEGYNGTNTLPMLPPPIDLTSVILIYSSDSQLHRNIVHRFATFLNNQCKCDVRFDAWHTDEVHSLSSLEWLLRQINSVDNIVIVHSEGSYKKYEAYVKEMPVEKLIHDTPLDDMFIPAVKELQNQFYLHEKRKKFFQVYFPYTEKRHVIDLKLGRTYHLMNHIEDLFLDLHGKSKLSRSGTLHALDITQDCFANSVEGSNLKLAIQEASEYFLENRDWFVQTYRQKISTVLNVNSTEGDAIDGPEECGNVTNGGIQNLKVPFAWSINNNSRPASEYLSDGIFNPDVNAAGETVGKRNISNGSDSGFESNESNMASWMSDQPHSLDPDDMISKPPSFDPHNTIVQLSCAFSAPNASDIAGFGVPPSRHVENGDGDILVRDRVFVPPCTIDSISQNSQTLDLQIESFNDGYDSE